MTEAEAREHLRQMLHTLTPGSILHLLSELFSESGDRARSDGDEAAEQRAREVAATLFVVGLGVDAVSPR